MGDTINIAIIYGYLHPEILVPFAQPERGRAMVFGCPRIRRLGDNNPPTLKVSWPEKPPGQKNSLRYFDCLQLRRTLFSGLSTIHPEVSSHIQIWKMTGMLIQRRLALWRRVLLDQLGVKPSPTRGS